MYKGIQAYTVLCLKPALQYTVFEQVKAMVVAHRPDGRLKAAEAFVLGMVARTISTICIFPYIRAKVVLQTSTSNSNKQAGSNNQSSSISIPQMLREMYEEEGFASWFRGLGPELTRGVLSSALMLMIKDQIGFAVQAALAANQKNKLLRRV
jgi:solute carrier family 25 (peroxisomal adenine nucleotide transporter), member 17